MPLQSAEWGPLDHASARSLRTLPAGEVNRHPCSESRTRTCGTRRLSRPMPDLLRLPYCADICTCSGIVRKMPMVKRQGPKLMCTPPDGQVAIAQFRLMGSRYGGATWSVNVIDEAISPHGGRSDGLRRNPFSRIFGSEYWDFEQPGRVHSTPNCARSLRSLRFWRRSADARYPLASAKRSLSCNRQQAQIYER